MFDGNCDAFDWELPPPTRILGADHNDLLQS